MAITEEETTVLGVLPNVLRNHLFPSLLHCTGRFIFRYVVPLMISDWILKGPQRCHFGHHLLPHGET